MKRGIFALLLCFLIAITSVGSATLISPIQSVDDFDIPLEQQNLKILEQTKVSENDAYAVAAKYRHLEIDPKEPAHTKIAYKLGDSRQFFVLDSVANTYSAVGATLIYSTAHLYFWIEENVEYELQDVVNLCETFEGQIYPLDREFFGSEATPGIDSDEHLFVLYTTHMNGASGYFSSADLYPQEIEPYSNEAEIFMLSAQYAHLDDESTYGILAHEFQHMIHQNLDPNESSWINEGFAELAILLNGYDVGGADWLYARNPDIQLNFWPRDEVESTLPHYGASFVFMTYLYDRFGEDFSKALAANPLNDLPSIDDTLQETQTNEDEEYLTADDVFQDWTIANLLQDHRLDDGKFGYVNLPDLSKFRVEGSVDCTTALESPYSVHQYGVDYYEVECDHPFIVQFKGEQTVPVVPIDPHSGGYYFWSNKGDQSDMQLTQTFDLSDVEGPVVLEYYTWYDLETDWDYVYLLASEDGENWEQLKPAHCSQENITGSNQGCGYNGASEGWVQEKVDLSQYAGKKVTLQFEYLTDAALNGEGFLLDDMRMEAIGYETDFEQDAGGWLADGFVRIMNVLPQTYRVAVIQKDAEDTVVTRYELAGNEPLILDFDATTNRNVYLVVSGTTRYTEMPASYTLEFQE